VLGNSAQKKKEGTQEPRKGSKPALRADSLDFEGRLGEVEQQSVFTIYGAQVGPHDNKASSNDCASRANASTNSSRACLSSQSQTGLPAVA
jgi:hypothetical protein